MKSIIGSFLLLTTLCLVPFVAFSSTFTSTNPIVLPTTSNEDNGAPVPVIPGVLDSDGEPVLFDQEYLVLSHTLGVESGAVDLAKIENSTSQNDVVFRRGVTQLGLPVKILGPLRPDYHPNESFIEFSSSEISRRWNNETFWTVGSPDTKARGLQFVGTTRFRLSIYQLFQIEKFSETSPSYKIRHCPGQGVVCEYVGLTFYKGHTRLAKTNEPFPFIFKKVPNTDA